MKNRKISKNIFENLLIAVCVMVYFILINFAYYNIPKNSLLSILKILSMIVLTFGIIILEIAYRTDSGKRWINALEVVILAAHTLSVAHIVEFNKLNFANYILVSSYIFSVYYIFKAICIYTKERRDYLKSLSDIREIVANNPVKKEATKKGEKESWNWWT